MKTFQFDIKDWDIEFAVKGDCHACMIAHAIKRERPDLKNVQVDLQWIRFTDRVARTQYKFATPPEAGNQLTRYDEGLKIEPFRLRLIDPIETPLQKTGKTSVTRSGAKRPKGGRVKAARTPEEKLRIGRLRKHGLRAIGRAKPPIPKELKNAK